MSATQAPTPETAGALVVRLLPGPAAGLAAIAEAFEADGGHTPASSAHTSAAAASARARPLGRGER